MFGLIPLLASLGVAERFRKPVAYIALAVTVLALLGLLWAIWLHNHDASVIERHEEKITNQVDAVSSEAAASASAAVDQSRNEVERTNDQARDAASRSDDPLGDGLRSLRAGKTSPSGAAR